jgi:cob(I)alamin adenosyltransferase
MVAMKIYTKSGDQGETGLLGGARVRKDHLRIEAAGTVDELNAFLGLARSEPLPSEIARMLEAVQNDLFSLGAELATPEPRKQTAHLLGEAAVTSLEQAIDSLDATLPPLTAFILPAGGRATALIHVARAVCRRAERRVISLAQMSDVELSPTVVHYLNRLSDYLFVAARATSAASGAADVLWKKPSQA